MQITFLEKKNSLGNISFRREIFIASAIDKKETKLKNIQVTFKINWAVSNRIKKTNAILKLFYLNYQL